MTTATEQTLSGTWLEFRGRIREAWGVLTDNELDRLEGQRDQLIGFIERSTGEARRKIQSDLERFARETKYNF